MQRFNNKGVLIIPNPIHEDVKKSSKLLVVKELYCPNGHTLISKRCAFYGYPGIMVKVEHKKRKGFLAINPIYGKKSRVTIDIDIKKGDILGFSCPECSVTLPVHSECSCGGELIGMFSTKEKDWADCVGYCNRVDCENSHVINSGELISMSLIAAL